MLIGLPIPLLYLSRQGCSMLSTLLGNLDRLCLHGFAVLPRLSLHLLAEQRILPNEE